jgi:predicted amidohydrolase
VPPGQEEVAWPSGNSHGVARIALAQLDCALGDVPENARRATQLIMQARAERAQLLVFPELSLCGYSMGALADDVALTADDPTILALAECADDMDVAVGFVEQGPVHIYNSMAYLERGRVAYVQRKAYLPTYGRFDERKHFSPGQSLAAFDTRLGRMALLICNDAWQPSVPFIAVQDGARTLLVPSCSSAPLSPPDAQEIERDWQTLLYFYARFLQTYLVFVNRVGTEAGLTFWGGSRVVDPWGRTLVQAPNYEPALLFCELDAGAVRQARRTLPLVKEARLGREFERLTASGGDM